MRHSKIFIFRVRVRTLYCTSRRKSFVIAHYYYYQCNAGYVLWIDDSTFTHVCSFRSYTYYGYTMYSGVVIILVPTEALLSLLLFWSSGELLLWSGMGKTLEKKYKKQYLDFHLKIQDKLFPPRIRNIKLFFKNNIRCMKLWKCIIIILYSSISFIKHFISNHKICNNAKTLAFFGIFNKKKKCTTRLLRDKSIIVNTRIARLQKYYTALVETIILVVNRDKAVNFVLTNAHSCGVQQNVRIKTLSVVALFFGRAKCENSVWNIIIDA